ncbi:Smr domain protein [Bordetella bronchiseptica 00-P-2730]|nr:Smr domain protein [Bordetella bronchiseptica 00-P-2730]
MRGNKTGLADLKRLHEQVRETRARAEAAERETAARAAAAAPEADVAAFRRAVQAATPLKPSGRLANRRPDATPATAATVASRRAAALGEAAPRADAGVSDASDIGALLTDGGTAYVRAGVAPDTARNLKRGQWRVGAELDLHGLRVEQARHAVLSFLDECLEHGIRCVRIVHGKGYGSQGLEPVLKDKARTWLVQKADVLAFSEAPERGGGTGALLVLLRQAEAGGRP